MRRLTPPQLLILSFLGAIVVGSILLTLPQATKATGGLSLVDSIFTATSATCVTGLTVTDTGGTFTPFGKWVIFSLFQAGGLGIMTFSTLFAVLLGRKLGFSESDVVKSTLDRQSILGLKKLIGYILTITFIAELIGAAVLFLRWKATNNWGTLLTIERAVFHSVSGFCNAGFSVFSDSLSRFRLDPVVNLTMIGLIFFGGIGFIVIMDLLGLFVKKKGQRKGISLQAKIALSVSFFLVIIGALAVMFFEKDNIMQGMTGLERAMVSTFQSVTARTAGFNTVDTGSLTVPSKLVLMLLMFIGASPGSTGGGIKTCTFLVILITIISMMRGRRRAAVFGRSIPKQIIRESLSIFFLASGWIFLFTVLLAFFERGSFSSGGGLIKPIFEVFSAFGTVGLSTGITAGLSTPGKVCIIATMFAGRVGPLTLALAVAFRERRDKYFFPEENIMVG